MRPGAQSVPASEQISRIGAVIEGLVRAGAGPVSVDTRSPEVAGAALDLGASFVNDVGCSIYEVAARAHVGYITTHIQGEPATMQDNPQYVVVVEEVTQHLLAVAACATAAGVPQVWIDPGIGLGKTPAHNVALLRALPDLVGHGVPVLLAVSRKAIIGILSGQPDVERRLAGSLAAAGYAQDCGVDIIRVHDVRETREFLSCRSALRDRALSDLA
jgi:dihydropteroate synthase